MMMQKRGIILFVFCIFVFGVLGEYNLPNSISLSGEGVIYAKPDECTISFGIEIFDASLEVAQKNTDTESKKLIAAIKEFGIEEDSLHTNQVHLNVERKPYDYNNNNNHNINQIIGFTVRRSYSIKLKNLTKVEQLIHVISKNGANIISSISFGTSKHSELKDQARIKAVREAKAKANLFASELGVKVGKPISISEEYGYHPQPKMQMMTRDTMAESALYEGTVPIGNIEISSHVSIIFGIDYTENNNNNNFIKQNNINKHECNEDIQSSLIP